MYSTLEEQCGHTGNHIAGIHSILVFDEPEAIHELDLGDLSGAMSVEMALDVSFCRWGWSAIFFDSGEARSRKELCDEVCSPFRGRLPRYNLVEETSVMMRCCG
jgi:hypothetical protein